MRPPPGTNSPAELLRSAAAGEKQKTEEEQDPRYKNIDMKMVELIKNEIMDQVKCFPKSFLGVLRPASLCTVRF